jgi:hypothetical protein
VHDLEEPAVLYLFPDGVEPRPKKPDMEGLPFAGGPAGITRRGRAADTFVVDPSLVDRSAIMYSGMLHAVAVQDLNLVHAMHVDAGIGTLGNQKFEIDLHVAKFGIADEICRAAAQTVDDDRPRS